MNLTPLPRNTVAERSLVLTLVLWGVHCGTGDTSPFFRFSSSTFEIPYEWPIFRRVTGRSHQHRLGPNQHGSHPTQPMPKKKTTAKSQTPQKPPRATKSSNYIFKPLPLPVQCCSSCCSGWYLSQVVNLLLSVPARQNVQSCQSVSPNEIAGCT